MLEILRNGAAGPRKASEPKLKYVYHLNNSSRGDGKDHWALI